MVKESTVGIIYRSIDTLFLTANLEDATHFIAIDT